jgi:hypothetical protein
MTKWVNLYLFLLVLNLFKLVFFTVTFFTSIPLLIIGFIIIYLSYKNQTTSIVHITMFLISIVFLVLSLLRI